MATYAELLAIATTAGKEAHGFVLAAADRACEM